jgi:hypothetical protein
VHEKRQDRKSSRARFAIRAAFQNFATSALAKIPRQGALSITAGALASERSGLEGVQGERKAAAHVIVICITRACPT